MRLTFIESPEFTADWRDAGYGDAELRELQKALLADPEAGATLAGTRGLRKVRFAPKGRGKSGGSRVCYVHIPARNEIALLIVYGKGEKSDLSPAERRAVRPLVERIKGAPSW